MFQGFKERLEKEITAIAPKADHLKINVAAPPQRKYSAWIGASIFATTPDFSTKLISHAEYNEHGPTIISTKCF